jgi:hypothetical protein
MTADLVTETPTGEITTRVRVLSYHLDCEHGLIAHIIPLSFPSIEGEEGTQLDAQLPSPLGEGQGEGYQGEGVPGVGFFVPFSTLTNIRHDLKPEAHTPSPVGEGRGEGSGEGL